MDRSSIVYTSLSIRWVCKNVLVGYLIRINKLCYWCFPSNQLNFKFPFERGGSKSMLLDESKNPHIHSPTCSKHMALQLVFKTAVHYIKQWLSSKCWPQRAFNHIGTKKSRRLEYLNYYQRSRHLGKFILAVAISIYSQLSEWQIGISWKKTWHGR